jgi:RNA polymerase sigma-70 factor (ECF subfamily)
LQDQDAADLLQEVFATLLKKLPEFQYDRNKSFRGWLRTVLRNKWREFQRQRVPTPVDMCDPPLAELVDSTGPDPFGESEYCEYLVHRALVLIQGDFQPVTWKAWQEFAVAGRPAAEVARELGLTRHAVYLAKARVLSRIRQELHGLLDEGPGDRTIRERFPTDGA